MSRHGRWGFLRRALDDALLEHIELDHLAVTNLINIAHKLDRNMPAIPCF
jgi:hypothetical protein